MKNLFITSITILTLVLDSGIISSCNSQSTSSCNISATDFAKKDLSKAVIIDVRTPGEFGSGHLKGAEMIDISNREFQAKIGKLNKSATYFVYCKTGVRSRSAVSYMVQNGFTKVCNIDGGTLAMVRSGVKLEK
jgi:rhodanese-related sulfurtransferase